MKLIVITPEKTQKDETTVVNLLFANGLRRLHIRKPDLSINDTRKYINAIASQYHANIVITSFFELLDEFDLGGIHLNSHLRVDEAIGQAIRNIPPALVSTSFHSWQEVLENEYPYGYVFISPVFDSISKAGYKADIDLADAQEIKQKLSAVNKYCPQIIGLGGVGVKQIQTLHHYGFDGAAMLGEIWMADDPVQKLTEAQNTIKAING